MCTEVGSFMLDFRKENSWLEIQLYCTGDLKTVNINGSNGTDGTAKPAPLTKGETPDGALSLESGTKANNEKFPRFDRPELKLASPFFLKPRYLSCICVQDGFLYMLSNGIVELSKTLLVTIDRYANMQLLLNGDWSLIVQK